MDLYYLKAFTDTHTLYWDKNGDINVFFYNYRIYYHHFSVGRIIDLDHSSNHIRSYTDISDYY